MINVIDSSLKNQSLRTFSANGYAKFILESLKEGETVSLESNEGKKFSMYKKSDFSFGVEFNSAGLNFENNPMRKEDALKILEENLSASEQFAVNLLDDLVLRLRDIFFKKNKDNQEYRDNFNKEDLFKNLSINQLVSQLFYYQSFLKIREDLNNQGLGEYLKNICEYLKKQLLEYPQESKLYKIINSKLNHIEKYKNVFSGESFVEDIKQKQSDLETFIGILSDESIEGNKFPQKISEIKKDTQLQTDAYNNAKDWFDPIYAWDAFAIPYSQFGDKYGYVWSMDQGTKGLAELNGRTHGSDEINRLGKKQEILMDDNVSFKKKEDFFKDANQEYINSIGFLLGTGSNKLTREKDYYELIKNGIDLDTFLVMPCSDVYPAVFQKSILPLYLKDLYQELCNLLGKKDLDKTIQQYLLELKNPSGIAKWKSAFYNNETKISSLEKIAEKISLLKNKFNDLDKQIQLFGTKKNEDLQKIASEFCVIENFLNVNNINIYPPFIMTDQEKRLNFMKNN